MLKEFDIESPFKETSDQVAKTAWESHIFFKTEEIAERAWINFESFEEDKFNLELLADKTARDIEETNLINGNVNGVSVYRYPQSEILFNRDSVETFFANELPDIDSVFFRETKNFLTQENFRLIIAYGRGSNLAVTQIIFKESGVVKEVMEYPFLEAGVAKELTPQDLDRATKILSTINNTVLPQLMEYQNLQLK